MSKYEKFGRAVAALCEEWDRIAYEENDGQWPSACDFIEEVFEAHNKTIGPTRAEAHGQALDMVEQMMPWLAKAVADGAFEDCALPKAPGKILAKAQELLESREASDA